MRLPDIGVPVLAMLGTEPDPMGWGTPENDVLTHLPADGRLVTIDGAGHFLHIEKPRQVADLVLEHVT
jgi:pimeloyl-ACP methyl ester carboxylesterase